MRILFIGDIFGSQGRLAIKKELIGLKQKHKIDFIIANAENTTHGRGLSLLHYKELVKYGIDFFTFGNHTWNNEDIKFILDNKNTVRPMNVNKNSIYSSWGVGSRIVKVGDKSIRITNLIGKSITMHKIETDSPFIKFTEFLEHCEPTDYHIVDFHAEATAEKKAFFLTFVGQVNAILGTHTHVQTNDAIIVNGTAFITDAGMTGATNGVIGADPDTILDMYNGRAERFILSPAKGKYQFNAVVVELDDKNNETKKITPINILEP